MRWPDWLGVGERRWEKSPGVIEVQPAKTAWDWLQLLIVPAMLAGLVVFFNASQASRDQRHEDNRIRVDRALEREARYDATLESYLTQMSKLMLERHLLNSRRGSPLRKVARAITLTTLRRLDGRRKGEVVRFLHEAGLLHYGGTFLDPTLPLS